MHAPFKYCVLWILFLKETLFYGLGAGSVAESLSCHPGCPCSNSLLPRSHAVVLGKPLPVSSEYLQYMYNTVLILTGLLSGVVRITVI